MVDFAEAAKNQAAQKRARVRELEADLPLLKAQTTPAALERRRARFLERVKLTVGQVSTPEAALLAIGRLRQVIDDFNEPESLIAEHHRLRADLEAAGEADPSALQRTRGL